MITLGFNIDLNLDTEQAVSELNNSSEAVASALADTGRELGLGGTDAYEIGIARHFGKRGHEVLTKFRAHPRLDLMLWAYGIYTAHFAAIYGYPAMFTAVDGDGQICERVRFVSLTSTRIPVDPTPRMALYLGRHIRPYGLDANCLSTKVPTGLKKRMSHIITDLRRPG